MSLAGGEWAQEHGNAVVWLRPMTSEDLRAVVTICRRFPAVRHAVPRCGGRPCRHFHSVPLSVQSVRSGRRA
jgi:hypothetical protein